MLKILRVLIFFTVISNFACAAEKPRVAVMDLGAYSGSVTSDLKTEHIGEAAAEYIIQALNNDGRFAVVDSANFAEKIAAKNLKTAGLIPPSVAREIAAICNVDYLIYGNISGVNSDSFILEVIKNGGKFHSLKVKMIVRMMKVETGDIVSMAEGVGVSKSSEIKLGKDNIGFITVGKDKIPQNSVINATKKAAYSMVKELGAFFFDS